MVSRNSLVLRRILLVGGGVILCAAALLVAAKFWIMPAVIRSRIRAGLGDLWQGRTLIGDVEFNYSGPLRIRRLRLVDDAGDIWIDIGSVELVFRNWPSASPVLQDVRIDGVRVCSHIRDGKADWPLAWPEKKRDIDEHLDVRKIEITDISLGSVSDAGREVSWGGLSLLGERASDEYCISLSQGPEGGEEIIRGILGGKGPDRKLSLRMDRRLAEGQLGPVLCALGLGGIREAAGKVLIDAEVTGDFNSPRTLQHRGTVDLAGWRVVSSRWPELRDLQARVTLRGRAAIVHAISARICGGTAQGQFVLHDLWSKDFTYFGAVDATGLQLAELSGPQNGRQGLTKGSLWARLYNIRGTGLDPAAFAADVSLSVRGADLYTLTPFGRLLKGIGLKDTMDQFSDLDASFHLVGDRAVIKSAQVRSKLTAVRVAKGGTVDLGTGAVDVYVATLPVATPLDMLVPLPGLDVAAGITEKLLCYRVRGNYNRPDDFSVQLAPRTDLRDLDPGLLGDLLRASKRLGGSVGGLLEELMRSAGQGALPKPSRP